MIPNLEKTALYVRPGATDMRKQINGLSIIIENELHIDPFSSSLFLFCNKQKKILKILWWDRNGFSLLQKRLERDRFPWPSGEGEAQQITSDQLSLLLDGIDFWKAHKTLDFHTVR